MKLGDLSSNADGQSKASVHSLDATVALDYFCVLSNMKSSFAAPYVLYLFLLSYPVSDPDSDLI